MPSKFSEKTVQQFVRDIGDQHHTLAGTVIAVTGAQAAALGEACMQISLDNQVDKLDWQDVTARIEEMVQLKGILLDWADREASGFAGFGSQWSSVPPPADVQEFFEGPAEIASLCLSAVAALVDFSPMVLERLEESLNIAAKLLLGAADAAIMLLQNNLSRWSGPEYSEKFETTLSELKRQIDQIR